MSKQFPIPKKYRRKIGKIFKHYNNNGKRVKWVIVDFPTLQWADRETGVAYKAIQLRHPDAEPVFIHEQHKGYIRITTRLTRKSKTLAKKAMAAYKMLKVLDK